MRSHENAHGPRGLRRLWKTSSRSSSPAAPIQRRAGRGVRGAGAAPAAGADGQDADDPRSLAEQTMPASAPRLHRLLQRGHGAVGRPGRHRAYGRPLGDGRHGPQRPAPDALHDHRRRPADRRVRNRHGPGRRNHGGREGPPRPRPDDRRRPGRGQASTATGTEGLAWPPAPVRRPGSSGSSSGRRHRRDPAKSRAVRAATSCAAASWPAA
jgi:hypothetical protein